MTSARIALACVCAAWPAACGKDPVTELVVVVDTDLDVPDDIDRIEIRVGGEAPGAQLVGAGDLPVSLGVEYGGGPLEDVRIHAVGMKGATEVVDRLAVVDFVEGETRVVRLDLFRACVEVRCMIGESCGPAGCVGVQLEAGELAVWTGTAVRIADVPAAGTTLDGSVAECTPETVQTCPGGGPHSLPSCVDGRCTSTCLPGHLDCDEDAPGCEASISASTSCGSCSLKCAAPEPLCARGAGGGFECIADCGALTVCAESCVSTSDDPFHCGRCDQVCEFENAMSSCVGGTCVMGACLSGFGDCNDDPVDGCETDVLTDMQHCGACGAPCAPMGAGVSAAACTLGSCRVTACTAPLDDCNGSVEDGCETNLDTSSEHCGACGSACFLPCCKGVCPPFPTRCF